MVRLSDLIGTTPLYDTRTGQRIEGDDAAQYTVLEEYRAGGHTWHAIRGFSGDVCVHGPDPGEIHRDQLDAADDLAAWVARNYQN